MSLTSWLWGTNQVDEAIDKATSELLPTGTEDIALNLEICDQIRSKAVQPKDAMRALKRRLNHKNPNVQLLALSLTDTCIKNGGDHFLAEVAGREFMDNLVSILKIPGLNLEVKNKILRFIQNWSLAFEGKPTLTYAGQVYKTLKSEGYIFPPQDPAVTSIAMVDTQTAPEWIDSDVCLRCRTPFSFTNRKHHCRNCGQVFDQQCSSKTLPLPHFGITQEVRVCDGCHVKLTRGKKEKSHSADNNHFSHHRHRSARDLADQELQRAIQLSLAEMGAPNGQGHARPGYVPSQPNPSTYKWEASSPPLVDRNSRPQHKTQEEEDDPDLKAAIEASLREANAPKASAPAALETPFSERRGFVYNQPEYSQSYPSIISPVAVPQLPNYDLQPLESDAILTFSQAVQHVEAEGGRDMSRYPAVTELYGKANGLRPKLAMSLDDTDRKEKLLAEMHEKLSHAVKLYDKLLTDQLSHPSWRTASTSQQQQYNPYPDRYNTVDGSYGAQWAPGPQQVVQSQATGYANSQPQYLQQQQQPPQQVQFNAQPQQQYYNQTQPQPVQYQQYNQPVESTMAPTMPQYGQSPSIPMSLNNISPQQQTQSPPPQSQAMSTQTQVQYISSSPVQQQHQQTPLIIQPPPPNTNAPYQQVAQAQVQIPNAPYQIQSSEPAPNANLNQPPTLVRQDSYTAQPIYTSSPPGFLNQPATHIQPFSPPPRQDSLAVAPQPQQISQQQQQPTYSISQFPSVPSSNPQAYPLYDSGPPIMSTSGFEQGERKEALLIDL